MRSNCITYLFLFLLLYSQGCAPKIQTVEDLNAIRSMFQKLRNSYQKNDGASAVKYLTNESGERYEQFRDWAIQDSPETLANRSTVEQVEVVRLRVFLTPEELKEFSGQEVIAKLIDLGIIETPFVQDATLAEPVFKGDVCFMQIFDQQGAVKEKLTFIREEGKWKLDLPSLEYVHEKIYRGMKRKKDFTDKELVERIASSWKDHVDTEKIWAPIAQVESDSSEDG